MDSFFEDVENCSIDNKKLLQDLKLHGQINLSFFVFEGDFELENEFKREKIVNYYKNLYKEKLYD